MTYLIIAIVILAFFVVLMCYMFEIALTRQKEETKKLEKRIRLLATRSEELSQGYVDLVDRYNRSEGKLREHLNSSSSDDFAQYMNPPQDLDQGGSHGS